MSGFLYGQTEYNMLKNANSIKKYVSKAKDNNYTYLSITDNNMYGHLKFYKECINNNIKPIIGLKVLINKGEFEENYLLLYAINLKGYKNLLKIASMQELQKKEVDLEALKNMNEGLFAVSAGTESDIHSLFANKQLDVLADRIKEYKKTFKNYAIGIAPQHSAHIDEFKELCSYAKNNKIALLPIHQTLYTDADDYDAYEALTRIEGNPKRTHGDSFYVPTKDELEGEFFFAKDLFITLEEVVNKIDLSLEKREINLPKYPNTMGLSSVDYLKVLCYKGLGKRLMRIRGNKQIYEERLAYELSVIHNMGFDDYFLIVWDFIKYAKNNDILVGPGRGSSAGSLVAFCLGITAVDPIKYDLLFERFLNPERISMPDIDVDFPDDKRDDVINYVKELYGKMHVCNISAYGTFLVKSSLRDLGRINKIENRRLEEVIKLVEESKNTDELLESVKDNTEIYELIKVAKKIEGLPRHVSTHAAGIILSDEPLTDLIPLQEGINGLYQSQLEAYDLESIGLLKMDFLAIRNLGIIYKTMKEIEGLNAKNINYLPQDDERTYKLLQKADTLGIFQLESEGIKRVLVKLKPTNFEDLIALLALYRPGPMDNIDDFIARKHGKGFNYVHPDLKDILKNTYGIIVYQEQIMKIATTFAGYSLGEADMLRRAVSKKDEKTLFLQRNKFVESSIKKGYDQTVANQIYDYIVKFANYGFNRSHSVAYTFVAYQMAYLKANHFPLFMKELLNNVIGSQSTMSAYIKYCKARGLKVLKPNVNASKTEFVSSQYGLFFPLNGITSIGEVVAKDIILEREKGLFKSFNDFKHRMPQINQRVLEALIYAGAFDIFGKTKKSLIDSIGNDLEMIDKFLDDIEDRNDEYSFDYLQEAELKMLGMNIEYDMFKDIVALRSKYNAIPLKQIVLNRFVKLVGVLNEIKIIKTKNNDEMAMLKIFDGDNEIGGVCFPADYAVCQTNLVKNVLSVIDGKVTMNNKTNKYQIQIRSVSAIGKG